MYLKTLSYYNYYELENCKLSKELKEILKLKVSEDKFDNMYETNTRTQINEFENYLNIDKFIELLKEKIKTG